MSDNDVSLSVTGEIYNERRRQVLEEGWTPEHDDTEHIAGDLAAAAGCYALNAANHASPYTRGDGGDQEPPMWPFWSVYWKPKDPRQDLVRAAALIVAEIERLDRAAARAKVEGA